MAAVELASLGLAADVRLSDSENGRPGKDHWVHDKHLLRRVHHFLQFPFRGFHCYVCKVCQKNSAVTLLHRQVLLLAFCLASPGQCLRGAGASKVGLALAMSA